MMMTDLVTDVPAGDFIRNTGVVKGQLANGRFNIFIVIRINRENPSKYLINECPIN